MKAQDWKGKKVAIAGAGKTGESLLRFAEERGAQCSLWDTRRLDEADWQRRYPELPLHFGRSFPEDAFLDQDLILCSPGLSPLQPALAAAHRAGIPLWGDIELFAQVARAPVLAITGSNGKSTVTTLVGEMAHAAGLRVAVGGNLGTPALELLPEGDEPELYVLELSSFQLTYCESLRPRAAAILNISPDHLDWHGDLADYVAAKWRIARNMGAGDTLVLPTADPALRDHPALDSDLRIQRFGDGGAGQIADDWLLLHGERLLPITELRIAGRHNQENALAAALLAAAVGIPRAAIVSVLRSFGGLPHRLQWVARKGGVDYYDDSKGTNLGASLRAIEALPKPLVLILGGDAKGADLRPLAAACSGQRGAVLLGKAEDTLAEILTGVLPIRRTGTAGMQECVRQAAALAQPGDRVLLSPACASLDMFTDYQDRGRQFAAAVHALEGDRNA
ncbi:UDP-N-acetylmuramoyl-L-alanine--D-glutamate ligase [Candidatus Igneacidithiobacillus taiwanensis]|uniref:UDP-N-acetylmuramoyl-L-alanine--D-glutamate ligase n=1 Tax=Candidatus Igneacidithiobacillus taiwanensis TaxID=1945924 RepID=UPI00289A7518|nr:UDP-N-acetylmuramoyl-L-alanine--D-glutamate ligase [Candidatus Igneacidithiobacillus taiwanensis]MCE5359949.1 UDP-N-acetylmuramoyl-L-alanine--D-glutamate ligase [Acidithiobacillus sp.]